MMRIPLTKGFTAWVDLSYMTDIHFCSKTKCQLNAIVVGFLFSSSVLNEDNKSDSRILLRFLTSFL